MGNLLLRRSLCTAWAEREHKVWLHASIKGKLKKKKKGYKKFTSTHEPSEVQSQSLHFCRVTKQTPSKYLVHSVSKNISNLALLIADLSRPAHKRPNTIYGGVPGLRVGFGLKDNSFWLSELGFLVQRLWGVRPNVGAEITTNTILVGFLVIIYSVIKAPLY